MSGHPTSGRQLVFACVAGALIHLAASPALAQRDTAGAIRGVVRDSAGQVMEEVTIRVEGTGRSTVSDRRGNFLFADLPPGPYTLLLDRGESSVTRVSVNVAEGSATPVTATVNVAGTASEELVVIADRREGLRQERDSINNISVLSAAQASKLPDINAAEAIRRLVGVTVNEDRGEGRFVAVRGAGSAFNRITINGAAIGSPESNGLSVPLDVFSAGAVSTIEVTKAVTPAQDGNSVGGAINLTTPTVFGGGDLDRSVNVRAGFQQLGSERIRVNANTEHVFGTDENFGVALNVAYNRRDFSAETVETSDYDLEDNVPGFEGSDVWVPDDVELRQQDVIRERLNLNAVFEWKPTANSRVYFQGIYSDFNEDEFRNRQIIQLEDAFDELDPNGPLTVAQPSANGDERNLATGQPLDRFPFLQEAVFLGTEIREIDFQRDQTPQEFLTLTLGTTWNTANWDVSLNASHSTTQEDRVRSSLDFRIEEDLAGEDVLVDVLYSSVDNRLTPSLTTVGGGDPTDPANYRFDDFDIFNDLREDDFTTLSADATRHLQLNDTSVDIAFGLRATLRDRRISFDDTDFDDPEAGNDSLRLSDPTFGIPVLNDDFLQGAYVFAPGQAREGLALISADPLAFLTDLDREQAVEYEAQEDVYATYLQGTIRRGKFTVLGGARVEQTEFDISSTDEIGVQVVDENEVDVVDESTFAPLQSSNSYTNVFPSVHVRYDFTKNVFLRASAGRTIRRPDFNLLSPERSFDVEQDATVTGEEARRVLIEAGNPDLDPLRSDNFEIGINSFVPSIGALSLTFFHKDISDITVAAVNEFTLDASQLPAAVQELGAGLLQGEFLVTELTVDSNSTGKISGFELGYSRRFDKLPGLLAGIGIDGNITWTESSQVLPIFDEEQFIGEVEVPFEDQSPITGNVTLSYERPRFAARLTYAFRDERLTGISFEDTANLITQNEYTQSFGLFGAKFDYYATDRLTLSWQGSNFNDANLRRFDTDRRMLRENERNGYWMEFGFRYDFAGN